ncbi:hypothetical protein WJX77_008552 [Trebouxia sp. C0004]
MIRVLKAGRQESRLRWQDFIGPSADSLSSTAQPSVAITHDDIKATLPAMVEATPTFDACVDSNNLSLFATSAHSRTMLGSATWTDLAKQCFQRSSPSTKGHLFKHDITSALVWMIKEAAEGNDLTQGLQNMAINIVGLRTSGFSELKPDPYIGNVWLCVQFGFSRQKWHFAKMFTAVSIDSACPGLAPILGSMEAGCSQA